MVFKTPPEERNGFPDATLLLHSLYCSLMNSGTRMPPPTVPPPPPSRGCQSTQHLPKLKVSNQKQEAAVIKQHLAAASFIRQENSRRVAGTSHKSEASDETETNGEKV